MASDRITVVTGGAGFIGSNLVERLVGSGRRVVVIDDCSTGRLENLASVAAHPSFRLIPCRVSQCGELPELMSRCEALFHLAAVVGVNLALASPLATLRNNLRESEVVLDAAAQRGVPVVLASTSEVYGKSQQDLLKEDDDLIVGSPEKARWSYASSKLMTEFYALALAREAPLPVAIARIFNTIGPRQTGQFGMVVPRFVDAAIRGQPLRVFGDGSQSRCFSFVTDTVEALLRLERVASPSGVILNVGSDAEISINQLAQLILDVTKSEASIVRVPYDEAYGSGFEDFERRKPDLRKMHALIGKWETTSLRNSLEIIAACRRSAF